MICCALTISVVIVILIVMIAFLTPVLLVVFGVVAVAHVVSGGVDVLTREAALALEYPYCRLYMSEKQLDEAFTRVQEYKLELVETDYKIINMPDLEPAQLSFRRPLAPDNIEMTPRGTLIKLSPNDYATMNWMSDWFNERARLSCKRYDEPLSPLDYWREHKVDIIDALSRRQRLTYEGLHDAVYLDCMGCNNFRPGLMRGVINMLGATSVLDPSAGWGDRLIGAIAAGVRYVGVDPNTAVHDGYHAIIERFAASNHAQYTMITAPFQDCELPAGITYDLVFTSPPYWDLEVYSDEETQSSSMFKDLESWFEGFLMASLRKAWEVLDKGGHMAIVINNIRGKPDFVMRMVSNVSHFPHADYLGVLSYAEYRPHKGHDAAKQSYSYKSPQPIWMWCKKSHDVHGAQQQSQQNTAERTFKGLISSDYCVTPTTLEAFTNTHKSIIGPFNTAEEAITQWNTHTTDDSLATRWYVVAASEDDTMHELSDSTYHGVIHRNDDVYSVWKKSTIDVNPTIVMKDVMVPAIATHDHGETRTFKVVRDDLLPGGTKQRGVGVINGIEAHEIVYAGPWNGYAQVALAIAGKLYRKKVTLFMTRDDYKTNVRAKMYGAQFIVIPGATLKQLQEASRLYVQEDTHGRHLMEFGFDSAAFRRELKTRILEAFAGDSLVDPSEYTGTVWITAGSGTLLNVLYDVFPKAQFAGVQVGKTIWPDQTDTSRTTIYKADEGFYDEAKTMPPYPAADRYDAKLWSIVLNHGADQDIIWNVAG